MVDLELLDDIKLAMLGDKEAAERLTEQGVLLPCPWCTEAVWVGVHDDEGNYHGKLGCDYENDPWSGLSYALHHDGWGKCILCTYGEGGLMGGALFDTAKDAIKYWNTRAAILTPEQIERLEGME